MHLAHTSIKIPLKSCQNWYLKSHFAVKSVQIVFKTLLVFAFIFSSSKGIHKLQPIISLYEDPCPSPIWKAIWPSPVSTAWQRCARVLLGQETCYIWKSPCSQLSRLGNSLEYIKLFLPCMPGHSLFRNSLVYALVLLNHLIRNSSHPPSTKVT